VRPVLGARQRRGWGAGGGQGAGGASWERQLRDGIDLGEVRGVLWNYLAVDHYERLVLSQRWPLERYSRWLAEAITSALCPR